MGAFIETIADGIILPLSIQVRIAAKI